MEETPAKVESEGLASNEERIGPYRVLRELGRGGMGTVYLCEDTAVGNRHVALKVVHDPRAGGTDLIERFRREIRNLGVLRHPNLVQVLYAGEHEGHPYFVMEYVRGRDLSKWLDEVAALPEPQRIAAIVRLMARVAHGVAHAHQNGTIHRDLKPQNILVREDGEPMVLDFGIAKHREDSTLTATAATPGTPSHMAPEQFEPAKIKKEELVDVWALGTILYLALTRERPFKGQSLASVSYQIVHGSPTSLRKLNPHVPPALEDVVMRCLEKDPRKRTQGAQILAQRLESALHDVIHSARRKRTRALVLVAGAALVLGCLAVQPWKWRQSPARFGHLKPVVLSVGARTVAATDREVGVASFQPVVRVRFDQATDGATLEAALAGEDGIEFERALLAPIPGSGHQASVRVPADQQREGMRARINIYANGERLDTNAPLFVLDATPPRIAAAILSHGTERPWEPDSGRIDVENGSELKVVVTDPSTPIDGEWDKGGLPKGDPSRRPIPIVGHGTWHAVLTVKDAIGNATSRTFDATIGAAVSRPESAASSRAIDPALPDVWGKLIVGSPTKPEGPVALRAGEKEKTTILVESKLDPSFKWKFRVLDTSGETVAECDLVPASIFGTSATRTLEGKLGLTGTPRGRLLSGQFGITDRDGRERHQAVPSPQFLEGALKPHVRLKTARREVLIELDRLQSPPAVQAFLDHARKGEYDGTVFHEVKKDQFVKAGVFDERFEIKHPPRTGIPEEWPRPKPTTAKMVVTLIGRAEFLIHLRDNKNLDLLMSAVEIGKVIAGEDVIGAIAREAGTASRPATPVAISKAVVEIE